MGGTPGLGASGGAIEGAVKLWRPAENRNERERTGKDGKGWERED